MRAAGCRVSEAVTVRAIAPFATIDGTPLPGLERLEIRQPGSFEAACFSLEFAIGAVPGGAAWFAGLQGGVVTAGIGSGKALVTGQVDNVAIRFDLGVAILSGRDLAARLIDAEMDQTFSNLTASEVATAFAGGAGLAANVDATTTRIGQYYELAHAQTGLGLHSRHATRWDLLAALAVREQFGLSVTGTTLNFTAPPASAPMLLTYGRDLMTLGCDRALALATPKVTVRSWNPKSKAAFSSSAGSSGGTTLIRPNLTQGEAERVATAAQAALAAQAVRLQASMPGETAMAPGTAILIQGTQTALDGAYVVRSVERVIGGRIGFLQHFEAMRAA